ncbi:MAG: replicative DNA helicase [Pseudomonadota bacterium]
MSEPILELPNTSPTDGKSADNTRLPYNIDAEQSVLGALLFDNEIYNRVSSFLKSEHFYDPIHTLIYQTCESLITQGRTASPAIVDAFLSQSNGFHELGGRNYLEQLAESVPALSGAHDFARIVSDLATSRGLIHIGADIMERAQHANLDDPPMVQVEDAEKALYGLAETGKYGGGFQSFHTAADTAIKIAAAAVKRGGGLAGLPTGFIDLDMMMGGLHSSDLIILAGRPSMGKTALATNVAVNVARELHKTNEDGVVGFFSLEMSAGQIAMRVIAETSRVKSNEIQRGTIDQQQFDAIYAASRDLERLPLHIDDTGGLAISQLVARARRLKRQHGLKLLVIDYLQLLSGSGKRSDNRVQEITEISVGLKALAKELNIPVIALSQLSRQVEARDDKRPQLADLRESGSIEQDADVVMFVYRESYYLRRREPRDGTPEHAEWQAQCEEVNNIAEVIIGKQRHGPIGKVQLHFEESLTSFSNLADKNKYPEAPGEPA